MARIENVNIDGTDYDVGKIASASNLGVVQVGSGLNITPAGVLSASGGETLTITVTLDQQDHETLTWTGATLTELETAFSSGTTIFIENQNSGYPTLTVTNASFYNDSSQNNQRVCYLVTDLLPAGPAYYLYENGTGTFDDIEYALFRNHASTSQWGTTKLSTSTSSTSTTLAATPSAVKAAYDLANSKVSITLSTTDIGQGASLAANTLYGVYE